MHFNATVSQICVTERTNHLTLQLEDNVGTSANRHVLIYIL